jgi:hypothetical protein
MTNKKTITRPASWTLEGIANIARGYNKTLEDLREAAMVITGEEDEFGHCGDFIFGECDVKQLLKKLDIKIK